MIDTATTEPATDAEPAIHLDHIPDHIETLRWMLVGSLRLCHGGLRSSRPIWEQRAIALQWAIDRLTALLSPRPPMTENPMTDTFDDHATALLVAARAFITADRARIDALAELQEKVTALRGKVAIRETARRAGLSPASVSQFFAGNLTLSPECAATVARHCWPLNAAFPVDAPEVHND